MQTERNCVFIRLHLRLACCCCFFGIQKTFQFARRRKTSERLEERRERWRDLFLRSPGRSPSFPCSFTSYQSLCYIILVGIFYLPTKRWRKYISKYMFLSFLMIERTKNFSFFSFSFHSFSYDFFHFIFIAKKIIVK